MFEEQIWTFIRGDMKSIDFEQWVCSNLNLENIFGKGLYLDSISANYKDYNEIEIIKQKHYHPTFT